MLLGVVLFGIGILTAPMRASYAAEGTAPPPLAYIETVDGRDGGAANVADLRGRVVVLNAWATWCAPCLAEMPELDRLQRAHPRELAVVALSNEGEGTVAAWAEGQDVAFTLGRLAAPDSLAAPYSSMFQALPTTFVIDRDGVVRATLIGGQELADFEAAVEPLL